VGQVRALALGRSLGIATRNKGREHFAVDIHRPVNKGRRVGRDVRRSSGVTSLFRSLTEVLSLQRPSSYQWDESALPRVCRDFRGSVIVNASRPVVRISFGGGPEAKTPPTGLRLYAIVLFLPGFRAWGVLLSIYEEYSHAPKNFSCHPHLLHSRLCPCASRHDCARHHPGGYASAVHPR
jgi:hypothetical protein